MAIICISYLRFSGVRVGMSETYTVPAKIFQSPILPADAAAGS